jgi:hypothetical protein
MEGEERKTGSKEASASFLKKRSKKLLFVGGVGGGGETNVAGV